MKTCRVCKKEKEEEELCKNGFGPNGVRYYKSLCKKCDAARRRAEHANDPEKIRASNRAHYKRNAQKYRDKTAKWRKENPEKTKEMLKKWREENPDKIRDYGLQRDYGITLEKYNEMKRDQKNKCYICQEEKMLVVDHCHETGIIRKLLCNTCNRFLGWWEKDTVKFEQVIKYLQMYKTSGE
ncbi:MAG: endonuclease VII domain-containing protein [Sphaerochaetaceae bacterium]|nr:endonuclease VII domain-containing protein [Sphaerochaetaceae bacterium]